MCGMQRLRVSVHERIKFAAEDFLLRVEEREEASRVLVLKTLLTELLASAAEEIVDLIEETIAEYEHKVERSEKEICRQKSLLDMVLKPEVRLYRQGVQRLLPCKEELPPVQQQKKKPHMDHDYIKTIVIKEEPEEVWIGQDREDPQGGEGADVKPFVMSTAFSVKSERGEEKPQLPQLQQTEESRGNSRGAELERNSLPGDHAGEGCEDDSESDTDGSETRDSETDSEESSSCETDEESKRELLTCPFCEKAFKCRHSMESHMSVHTGEKPFRCRGCGEAFRAKSQLLLHMGMNSGDNPFQCSVRSRFPQQSRLVAHMRIHKGERPFKCLECGKSFRLKKDLQMALFHSSVTARHGRARPGPVKVHYS